MGNEFTGGTNKAKPYQDAVVRAELALEQAMSGSINPERLNRARVRLAQAEEDLQTCLDGRVSDGVKVER